MQAYKVQELIRAPMTWRWLFWASAAGGKESKQRQSNAAHLDVAGAEPAPLHLVSPHRSSTKPPVASASDRAN